MAYTVMAMFPQVPYTLTELYVLMAYLVMAYVVMVYVVMAYIVMAYVVMAYIVMAYIVMAMCPQVPYTLAELEDDLGIGNLKQCSETHTTTSQPVCLLRVIIINSMFMISMFINSQYVCCVFAVYYI